MAKNVIQLLPQYFPLDDKGKPISSGYIYVGEPDTDPELVVNQKELSVLQEDNTLVVVEQPLRTSVGGLPVYDGGVVTMVVEGNYSLKVLNSRLEQKLYVPTNYIAGTPILSGNPYIVSDINVDVADANTAGVPITLIVVDEQTLLANLTVNSNVTLRVDDGAVIDGAFTLTVNGNFEAGCYTVFGASIVVEELLKVYPSWWGAVGDGATDDLVAIERALASAATSGATIYFCENKTFAFSAAIVVDGACDFVCNGHLLYTGAASANETAITFGEAASNQFHKNIKVSITRDTESDWSSEDDIGIKLYNYSNSKIDIIRCENFCVNVHVIGYGYGVAYCTFTCGWIRNGKYALRLTSDNSGWVNENLFLGGEFRVDNSVNLTVSRYGIYCESLSTYSNNNNVFVKPSIEVRGTGISLGTECVPVVFHNSMKNTIISGRNESVNFTYSTRFSGTSIENRVDWGYIVGSLNTLIVNEDTSTYKNNSETASYGSFRHVSFPVAQISHLQDYASPYNSYYKHFMGKVRFLNSTNELDYGYANIFDTHIEVSSPSAVGLYVDTNEFKQFIVSADMFAGSVGKLVVKCYDEDGTILSGTTPSYAAGTASFDLSYIASFGGCYRDPSDHAILARFFSVTDDVKKIFVGIAGGVAPVEFSGFTVRSLYGSCASWTSGLKGQSLALSEPVEGAHYAKLGQRVFQADPLDEYISGWVCTFVLNTTLSGAEAAGQTNLSVSDITGLLDGDIISIMLDNGSWQETSINGGPSAGVVVVTDALTSGAASGNTVRVSRWKEIPFSEGDYLPASSAALVLIGHAINTSDKYAGKLIRNSTTNKVCQARGSAAGDVWKTLDGVTTYTPT